MDPSGTYVRCDAKAIGSGAEGAQGSLGDIYHADITLKEATKHALTILKQVKPRMFFEFLAYSSSGNRLYHSNTSKVKDNRALTWIYRKTIYCILILT